MYISLNYRATRGLSYFSITISSPQKETTVGKEVMVMHMSLFAFSSSLYSQFKQYKLPKDLKIEVLQTVLA